jgi:protein ImuB
LEVQSVLRLWGGRQALFKRMQTGLQALGWTGPDQVSVACAATARAAQWLALAGRSSEQALAACSIDVIEEARPMLATFARMGIHTIGQIDKLPRAGLARRAGLPLVHALDEAFGMRPHGLRWVTAPQQFFVKRELAARADHTGMVEQAAAGCFHELAAWLLARQMAVRAITITLHHDDPPHTAIELKLAGASRDAVRLVRLFSEKLARFPMPKPVYEISISADAPVPLAHRTEDFLGADARAHEAMHELIERLSARLGEHHVQRLAIHDEHRPEQAMQTFACMAAEPGQGAFRRGLDHGLDQNFDRGLRVHRPAWLLHAPARLGMDGHHPVYHGRIKLLAGPERIEAGWWDDAPGGPMRRDYFIARSGQEELLWVFRTPMHAWYLHGLFG